MNNRNKIDVMVLAAGKGTRMDSDDIPKAMIQLRGKPLLEYVLNNIYELCEKPIVVVGYLKDVIRNYFNDKVIYAQQTEQYGTGHAVLSAIEEVSSDNFLVLNCDMPLIRQETLIQLINKHIESNNVITMLTTKVDDFLNERGCFDKFGRVLRDANGNVCEVKEFKDANELERSIKEVNSGVYMFNTKWFLENIRQVKNNNVQSEYYLTDMLHIAFMQGEVIGDVNCNYTELFGVNTNRELEFIEKFV